MRNRIQNHPGPARHAQTACAAASGRERPGRRPAQEEARVYGFNNTGGTSDRSGNGSDAKVDGRGRKKTESDAVIINEAQLILAEKRTSLAAMRTGIAVFAIPLSVLGLLIATSRYYDVIRVLHLIAALGVMLAALIALGTYLVVRALVHIRKYDQLIMRLKHKHSRLVEFLD